MKCGNEGALSPSLTLAPLCPGALPPAPNPGGKPSFPVLKTRTLPGLRPRCWRRVAVAGTGGGLVACRPPRGWLPGCRGAEFRARSSGSQWRLVRSRCRQSPWGGSPSSLRRALGEAEGRGPRWVAPAPWAGGAHGTGLGAGPACAPCRQVSPAWVQARRHTSSASQRGIFRGSGLFPGGKERVNLVASECPEAAKVDLRACVCVRACV